VPTRILGIIPARFASSRFPGKALASLAGKPVLQHVYERASQARYVTKILIATDDSRIEAAARAFGAPVRMTRADHASGTDRIAEVASAEAAEIVVNIQGDEPLIDPAAIDAAVLALCDDDEAPMGTLKRRIEDRTEIDNPNVVKVVTDLAGNAIYFSRHPIPYQREAAGRRDALQTYRPLRVPARFSVALFGPAGRAARNRRKAGTIASSRKRIPHPRGGDGIRFARRGHARGPGTRFGVVRSDCTARGRSSLTWRNISL
jgi:3-deoxy-D-manno-octulosonate cytidylyltransferase